MSIQNTVLILGAGVSVPYGYPSGIGLVEKIVSSGRFAQGSKFRDLRSLAAGLHDTGSMSIDRFLSDKREFLRVGIGQIVEHLLDAESATEGKQIKVSEDFFRLLLNELSETDFDKVTIITFNYDRLLEWRLFKRLRVFSSSDEEAVDRMSKLKIIHIHGRLAPFCSAEAVRLKIHESSFVPYGLEGSADEDERLRDKDIVRSQAYDSFKTVFTNDELPHEEAVAALKMARRVFFLGFGYDQRNMLKLGIGSVKYDWTSKWVAGTSFGLSTIAHNRVINRFPFLKNKLHAVSARAFFEDHFSIEDASLDGVQMNISKKSCCEISAIQEQGTDQDLSNFVSYTANFVCQTCKRRLEVTYSRSSSSDRKWAAHINGRWLD